LPEEEIETAKRFLEFLATHDPAVYSLYTAPYDDEPTFKEEDLESQKSWTEYLTKAFQTKMLKRKYLENKMGVKVE